MKDDCNEPVVAGCLVSEDLARALQESDKVMESFRLRLAAKIQKDMEDWADSVFLEGGRPKGKK